MKREAILNAANWVLPPNIFRLLTYYKPSSILFALTNRVLLTKNKKFYNRHLGERCFILASGPSVKQQNIKLLKNEIVFSVSTGYLHPDYAEIAPRYHCIPQITYSEKMTKQTVIDLFREMDKKTGNAEIFLSHQELSLIKDHAIFAGRDINYICMGKNHFPDSTAIPDITGIIPRVGSVPIMALMLALNMGFKEIYILGADHDWFAKNEYKYSFEPTVMKGKDFGVNDNGTLTEGILEQLPMAVKLWSQYRAIKNIAKNCGANIYSANPQTLLDEFPKISLEEAVGSKIG